MDSLVLFPNGTVMLLELLERVTLTGISKARLRFLFQDRTPTYLAALIFVTVPILSYIKLLVAGDRMRLFILAYYGLSIFVRCWCELIHGHCAEAAECRLQQALSCL